MRILKVLLSLVTAAIIGFFIAAAFITPQPEHTCALNPGHDSCAQCHNLHSAPGQSLMNQEVVETLCLSCHGPTGPATKKAEVHTNKDGSSYSFTMTCINCHDPHQNIMNRFGGTNLAQVGKALDSSGYAMLDTPNNGLRFVTFQSRGTDAGGPSIYSFADNDEDGDSYYDGVCETCHTQVANHRNNSSGAHNHYTGINCIVCHPHDANFHGSGGGCLGCHGGTQGPRRGVTGEFELTSHHAAGGAVTDDDCGVCHYEAVDSGFHMNNAVDLRDPDTGNPITAFTQFSRDTSSETLESWVVEVQNNFCLKCHDLDGATATYTGGSALLPFSSSQVTVPNVSTAIDPGNNYHHAVLGPGDNEYCVPSTTNGNNITMEPPWNQDGNHDVISCFDCHAANGHGSSNQRMLRTAIDLATMEATTDSDLLPAGMGVTVDNFCTLCHKASVYISTGNSDILGSVFEFHGASQQQHSSAGGNELGCLGCHGGIVDFGPPAPDNGSARGNIHGGNFVWPSGTFSSGVSTETFMVGGWNGGWDFGTNKQGNPEGYCSGGDCNHTGSATKNGQKYSR